MGRQRAELEVSGAAEFQKRIAFDSADLTDQYALDFDTYINWKAVASLLPQANDRVLFQKTVGDMILDSIGADIEAYDASSRGSKLLGSIVPT